MQGDGRRTISELIAAVNATQMALPSWKREPLYPTDALAVACLQQAGYSLDSVPLLGVWAALRRIESTEWGGLDEDYSATLHPDNAAIARQAAALFCLDVAGIDIISPDITRPWHENGAVINEVNSAPVLGQSLSSLRAMPQLLQRLLVARGRIAIEAFVGTAKAMEMARQRQQAFQEQGIACYVTSHNFTLNAAGQVLPMALEGLFARCTALLANKSVAALVLVVQTDESLYSGLPADTLDRVVPSGEQLFACSQGNSPARVPADAVVAFLKSLGGENQVSTIEPCSTHPFKR